jgi:hypothetical protein
MSKEAKKRSKYSEQRIDLREIEEEAIAAGQEWIKQRIENKLREKAAAFFPRRRKNPQGRPAPEGDA